MKIAIIGVGNPLMGDDGVGIAVLDLLRRMELPDSVKIFELGTGGMRLLHLLPGFEAAIIIDAADFGAKPGKIRLFKPEDVHSLKRPGCSLHEWDLFTTLKLSKKLGECPENINIVAIQPEDISSRTGLSHTITQKLPKLAQVVTALAHKLTHIGTYRQSLRAVETTMN